MNREKAKRLLPIIQHFANGGKVEGFAYGFWSVVENPTWAYDKYRIKSEPLECWVNYAEMCRKFDVHPSPESAETNRKPYHARIAVHMREVEE